MKTSYLGYSIGDRVSLVFMDDPQAPKRGTLGTIVYVDDMNQIGVKWDNGSSLSVILEAGDQIRLEVKK